METAQQADSPDRVSPVIIATTPARKIPGDTRPVILGVGQTRIDLEPWRILEKYLK